MKKQTQYLFSTIGSTVLLLIIALGSLTAQAQTDNKLVYDLSGYSWRMEGALPGEGVKMDFHKIAPDRGFAHVPGDVFTDLWRAGRIDDPHFGTNSQKAKWINDYEWWYFRNFDVPKGMEGKKIRVVFDGVDFACDVWLNGEFLGSHEGMFSDFSFNITDLVKFTTPREPRGRNNLTVRLAPAPRTFDFVSGRKFRWHGDYNQNVVPTGIWRPVRIEASGIVRIEDTYIESKIRKNGSADLNVKVELINDSKTTREIVVDINIAGDNFQSKTYSVSVKKQAGPGSNIYDIPVEVKDPKLWWPWDLGDQNLYSTDVSISETEAGFQDREKTGFGIRELKMAMNPGWTKDQVENPWTVMINGKRHFMRSGTWGGPPDMFYGRSYDENYRELIRLAKEANINNLRIFNWHPPEIPLFYQLCNEAGITVWQDLVPISGSVIPGQEFKELVFNEAISVLKQKRNYPCLVFLEGAEEILYTSSDSASELNIQFVNELGEALKPYTNLHYIPTSPLSDHNGQKVGFKTNESIHAHRPHYGLGMLLMEEYYPTLDYAAIPELAITSCPNVESIKKFIPEDELWPPGPSWGYHWADLDVLRAHNYEVLGDQFTGSLEAFVEATQISQGTYFQFALEHFRRRKPKTSAICYCHYILNTPDMKWATVDYYLQPKKSHYYVKKAYQPLLVSLQYPRRRWLPNETFTGSIWVVNDYFKDYKNCTAEIKFIDQNKKIFKEESLKIGNVSEDSSKEFVDVSCKVPGQLGDKFYVELTLLDNKGNQISANDYMLLVADEKEAKGKLKQMGAEAGKRSRKYGGTTFRYFPELFDKESNKREEGTVPALEEFK